MSVPAMFLPGVLVAALLHLGAAKVSSRSEPWMNPDLFEGDITGIEDWEDFSASIYDHVLWAGGRVPYVIDSSLDQHRDLIFQAFRHYEERTCIRFVPKTEEGQVHIHLFSGNGCYSPIGQVYQGGVNKVSIGPGCEILPIVIHELGHSLGFFHEQNRSDRDDYLDIHWDNMQEWIQVAFFKHRPGDDRILTPFDHDSIMLYGELTGSKDGISKTLTAKNGHYIKESYMKSGLSPLDIEKVNKLYGCR